MTKADDAYDYLADLIEQGTLAPGSSYTESALIEMSGYGRTPLREAVQRLTRDHLVATSTGAGIVVPSMSVDDQLGRLEIRRSLEALAVVLASQRGSGDELAGLNSLREKLTAQTEPRGYLDTLRRTHQLMCVAAHNDYLAEIMRPLHVLSRRFWGVNLTDAATEIDQGKTLHKVILEAVARRDAAAAQEASIKLNDYLVESALAVASRRAQEGHIAPVTMIGNGVAG
ncbi:GntR family transcriptional regulator [Corynebacterium sp. YIM 101645]|uniref:GntR family transcriptional regulator n=1 Tax=Corynebacterium lemuris TaxID=1859292 RepID=A0ABT2FUN0_9CORY|nr:GntR family transcriptional regulator [Corynebacterium lemuris]MCS5478936.1 GntR family transcriptional regulator [Corynebacterium lemuris]